MKRKYMMDKPNLLLYIKKSIFILGVCVYFSCSKKDDFLNAKPSTSLLVPNNFSDFQQLLDNATQQNGYMNLIPPLGEESADDYYMTSDVYNGGFLSLQDRN